METTYYIFKHHLKDQEITGFLDKDFNSSIKAFKRYGGVEINENIEEISKNAGYDFHIDDMTLLNRPGKYHLDFYSNEAETENARESWHLHVMAIYNYWKNKANEEAKIGRPSKYAFKNSCPAIESMTDIENMVWYCVKHNLTIEQAEKYIRDTLNKRSHINKMRSSLLFSCFDAYYLRDILKIDNSIFHVKERICNALKGQRYENIGGTAFFCWCRCNDSIPVRHTYYETDHSNCYGGIGYKLNELCDTVNELTMKMYDYYEKCPLTYFYVNKRCNYTEHACGENEYDKLPTGEYIDKKRPDFVNDPIEPIRINIALHHSVDVMPLADVTEEIFNERREMYFNITMFIFLLFKSLDYTEPSKVMYEEYSRPIYKTDEPTEPEVSNIAKTDVKEKQSAFKNIVNKIIKNKADN